jgi:hypothetical protein
MYSLLVTDGGWTNNKGSISAQRVFEQTAEHLENRFIQNHELVIDEIVKLPTIFVTETSASKKEKAVLGTITSITKIGNRYNLEFDAEPQIPPILNTTLARIKDDLHIEGFEFIRTHWAVKEPDLYKILLLDQYRRVETPKVFSLERDVIIDDKLMSVMMPFAKEFDDVYKAINSAALKKSMKCKRADDIWEHDHVFDDVVHLIDHSRIIVCDCTGRNPNVFYEAGIAHTLGRHVILITQNPDDIPFDLRHLRYIHYATDVAGRAKLEEALVNRIGTLLIDRA